MVVVSLNSNYDIRISHRMRSWFILLANATITHIFFWMNASCPYFLLIFSFAFITILLPYLHPKTVYIRITVTGHLVSQFRIFSITYKIWNAAPSSYIIVGGGEGMYLVKTQYMLFSIVDYHLFKNFLYSNIYNNRIRF